MKEILLTQGKVALVDDEDFEKVSQLKWYAHDSKNGRFYARHDFHIGMDNGKELKKRVFLHRFLLNMENSQIKVDHINGNTLDCRRRNLRTVTDRQNVTNQNKKRSDNTSGFRGIHKQKGLKINSWYAYIRDSHGKRIILGRFPTAELAAKSFDKAAKEIYGEFCGKLNFE